MTFSRLGLLLLACSACSAASEASAGGPTTDTQPDADLDATFLPPRADAAAAATILVFVHGGSHDLAPFRVCVDPAGTPLPSDFSHPMPLANYPGVPVGGAASLGDVDDKITLNVTLVDALALAGLNQGDPRSRSCNDFTLLSPAAHEAIAAPVTLVRGAVNVAIVQGSAGSRTVKVVTLDPTPPADKKIRLQWGQFATGLGTASASFSKNGFAGAPLGTVAEGAIAAGSVEVDFDPSSPSDTFDTSGITVSGTGQPRFFSLTDIQSATDPTTVPTQFFTTRVSFGVLAIGDANAVDASAGEGVHLLAIPAQL